MKKTLFVVIAFVFITVMESGCKTMVALTPGKADSPGQMKKATGSKSARPFAPGQRKKKSGN